MESNDILLLIGVFFVTVGVALPFVLWRIRKYAEKTLTKEDVI